MKRSNGYLTLPNLLTAFRLMCSPVLLWLAWQGSATAFLLVLAAAFFSDAVDGLAARVLGQTSLFGAKLDSCADVALFFTLSVSAWWLWPQIIRHETAYVGAVVASYVFPGFLGYLKFGTITSYHTRLVKLALAATGTTFYLLVLADLAWPFRLASALCVLAAFEELAITCVSKKLHSNVRSLWDVLYDRENAVANRK